VDTQLHETRIKLAEEVGIPVSALKKIWQIVTAFYSKLEVANQAVKTSKYDMIETIFLGWFCQKWAMNIPVTGPQLRQKAVEMAIKLNIDLKDSNRLIDSGNVKTMSMEVRSKALLRSRWMLEIGSATSCNKRI
jgi:hypothetical protein